MTKATAKLTEKLDAFCLPESEAALELALRSRRKACWDGIRQVKCWARAAGAVRECAVCNCELIDTAMLAKAVQVHLRLDQGQVAQIRLELGRFIFLYLGEGHWQEINGDVWDCGVCAQADD